MISRLKNKNFSVMARMRALPAKVEELRRQILDLVDLTQIERGCLSCEMIENRWDSTEFTILQKWSHEEDHNAHFVTDRISNAMKSFSGLLSDELDLCKHEVRLNSIRYGTNSYCLTRG